MMGKRRLWTSLHPAFNEWKGRWTMRKIILGGVAAILLLFLYSGCRAVPSAPTGVVTTPIDAEAAKAIDEQGDLIVSGDFQVFSVDSKTNQVREILQTGQPISSVSYTKEHTVVTVFDPNNPDTFRGFYLHNKNADKFEQYATPSMSPKFSHVNGDLLFLASADTSQQQDGDYSKVGIYQLKERKWVKEWTVPGGIEDVTGIGNNVWFVTANNASTSSNVYKLDLATGEWSKLIQEPRRYPLDQVEVDSNGEMFMMISQRHKTEWSNKIFRFNPQQIPYELTSNFVSNTRPFSYTMKALKGKMLIALHDVTGSNPELDKPLSLLDLKSRKQVHLVWEHQPIALGRTADQFVALAEDGALAFISPDAVNKPDRTIEIPELQAGRWVSVKK